MMAQDPHTTFQQAAEYLEIIRLADHYQSENIKIKGVLVVLYSSEILESNKIKSWLRGFRGQIFCGIPMSHKQRNEQMHGHQKHREKGETETMEVSELCPVDGED